MFAWSCFILLLRLIPVEFDFPCGSGGTLEDCIHLASEVFCASIPINKHMFVLEIVEMSYKSGYFYGVGSRSENPVILDFCKLSVILIYLVLVEPSKGFQKTFPSAL